MQSLLKELLPEQRIRPMMEMAAAANGFFYARATWRVARLPGEICTDDVHGVIAGDLEVHAHLWFRRTWSGKDGRPRRRAGYALVIYVPQRSERRLFLERDLNAALAHLSEPALDYDAREKCWIEDECDQVHRDLPQRDADPLWNRDDFGRDLAPALFE